MAKRLHRRCGWVLMMIPLSLYGAEMGYHEVQPAVSARQSAGASVNAYADDFMSGNVGLGLNINWNALSWKIGNQSYNDRAWASQASLIYGMNEIFDIRASAKYFSGQDAKSDLNALRLGIGTRAWFHTGADFIPFAGASLNYYVFDVNEGSSPEGMFGLSAEAGVAYIMSEWVAIEAWLHGETALNSGSVSVSGKTEDVSLQSLGMGLGVTILF